MYHPKGTRNHAGINDAKLTAMIEQQMRTLDRAQRKQQIFDIQRYLGDQMYYVPSVINYRTCAATQPQIHDMFPVRLRPRGGDRAEAVDRLARPST